MGCVPGKQARRGGANENVQRHQQEEPYVFHAIADKYETFDELVADLRASGLETCQLMLGIDATKSCRWNGARTFGGRSLHHLSPSRDNFFQRVIRVAGRTLESFDDDCLVPAYLFGDAQTTNRSVRPLNPNGVPACRGFEEVLRCYEAVMPHVTLSGPTSFAPLIREAVRTVRATGQYHILIIIADGQVSESEADDTARAIVEASDYPLSLIMVGVGDGPWDAMERYDDSLPERRFDNFQFVNFSDCLADGENADLAFARMAMMEIPDQYKAVKRLKLLERVRLPEPAPPVAALPSAPPLECASYEAVVLPPPPYKSVVQS